MKPFLRSFFAAATLLLAASCTYMKMNPPPDADKPSLSGDNSCYLATASNMLAGAGYGDGATVQARADDIYAEMKANFGIASGGWTDTALTWWLSSSNNTWPTNPYDVVTVYGNKSPKNPWANSNGAQFIANELRTCHFVGLSISWPVAGPTIGSGGHAITAWGDLSGNSASVSANPAAVRVTDSDNDTGGNVQQYTYDSYTSPNPGGANEGNGWYFDYDPNHPYMKHIITLSPAAASAGTSTGPVQLVVGSYKIHQTSETAATDLHYKVGTDVDILSYNTRVDWTTEPAPKITEGSPRRSLQVDWNFARKPVPQCTWVTITTEFVLPFWNSIHYEDVHFTYPRGTVSPLVPDLRWEVLSPEIPNAARIRNVTGGYVIGAFDVVATATQERVGEYRFVHQYSFNQSPEQHTIRFSGREGFAVTNMRVGHSYGVPAAGELWQFRNWMTELGGEKFPLSSTAAEVKINWSGRLPYPEGEDITGRIPQKQRDNDYRKP